jgi:hypothetical protein
VALGGGLLALVLLRLWARRRSLRDVMSAAIPIGAWLLATAALFLFRKAYFGFWLPNTYYAKVGTDLRWNLAQGYAYFSSFVDAYPAIAGLLLLALICTAGCVWVTVTRRQPASGLGPFVFDLSGVSAAIFLFGVASTIYVGGDHFGGWRFLQPYWPFGFMIAWTASLLLIASIEGGLSSVAARSALPALAAPLLLGILTLKLTPISWRALSSTSHMKNEFSIAEGGRQTGQDLNDIFAAAGGAVPSVGVIAAGGLGLAYAGTSYDLLGLNNVAMAHASRDRTGALRGHAAFDADVFYRQAPQVVVTSVYPCSKARPPSSPIQDPFTATVLKHIDREPRFRALYAPVLLTSSRLAAKDVAHCVFIRRDYLARVSDKISGHALPVISATGR